MNFVAIEFTLNQNSLDIYLAGCDGFPKCENCHNSELWNFNQGKKIEFIYEKIENYLKEFPFLIKNLMIFGGEPLDQPKEELLSFLKQLNKYNKKIWLFTRFELNEIPQEIISECNFIKTGRYIPSLSTNDNICFGIKLATSNQTINKIKE